MWKICLNYLSEINNSFLKLIDIVNKTHDAIGKEKCEITKQYEASQLEYTDSWCECCDGPLYT